MTDKSFRAYIVNTDGDVSFRCTRQHPQSLRCALRRKGFKEVTVVQVHQAELRALRVLPEALMSDLGAKLIHSYDEQAKQ